MGTYYNEWERYPAAWLENLSAQGLIAMGEVDRRSITDVQPANLAGHDQCHFFAGIGGWSYALRLAGWPDDYPVWTGSCPCQPFSVAGKRKGTADDRHLWPAWFRLIRECRPAIIFGEQVSSKDGLKWLDLVHADLEGEGYAVGAADLCAAAVGASQARHRIFFVAITNRKGGKGLEPMPNFGAPGPWRWRGEADMRVIAGAPFEPSNRWPEPILRRVDDGLSDRVARLRAYGNAIVPQVAAEFIRASMEALCPSPS